jgi:hypothetical protein
VLARQFENFIHRAQNVRASRRSFGIARQVHKTFEGVAEVPNAFDVMPQRLAHTPRAHNQNIARLDAPLVTAIDNRAPHQPSRAQQHRRERDG